MAAAAALLAVVRARLLAEASERMNSLWMRAA